MAGSKTKKLLVAHDSENRSASNDFLVPTLVENDPVLFGLKSGSNVERGMVVYTGRDVSVNDIFARLVDSGKKIASVDHTLAEIAEYIDQLKHFNIGDILSLQSNAASKCGFLLRKRGVKRAPKRNLP